VRKEGETGDTEQYTVYGNWAGLNVSCKKRFEPQIYADNTDQKKGEEKLTLSLRLLNRRSFCLNLRLKFFLQAR
jgi:hypothetical protein